MEYYETVKETEGSIHEKCYLTGEKTSSEK